MVAMKKGPKSKSSKSGRNGVKRTKKRSRLGSSGNSHKISRPIKKLRVPKAERKIINKRYPIKKDIIVRRSSGRKEIFDTNRLAQTVSRSGVPYLMARDIAKTTTKKIKSQMTLKSSGNTIRSKSTQKPRTKKTKPLIVNAKKLRNLVAEELRERNRPDIASSYTGKRPEQVDLQIKPNLDDKEPILDKVAANRTKVLFDPSKQKGSS
jgi:hypothetical protein